MPAQKPNERPLIRNVTLRNISQRASYILSAQIEDVSLHTLERLGDIPLFFWGCLFRHVTLSGRLSGMKINNTLDVNGKIDQRPWDEDARRFYQEADWALDITKAEFQGSVTFEAIPGHLIRRDESTQILVSREKLERVDWRSFDFGSTCFSVAISWFIKDALYDSVVLVAPKKSRKFKEDLKVLEMLRREGVTN